MILVDTSVWVDHLRKSEPVLNTLLNGNNVLMHSMVMGELACGYMHEREQALDSWHSLPKINELSHERVILLIETKKLMGRGIGFCGYALALFGNMLSGFTIVDERYQTATGRK